GRVRSLPDEGRRRWRRGRTCQRCRGTVGGVCTGECCRVVGRQLATSGVVSVYVNGQVKVRTQLGHKCRSGIWAQQTSHILNSQYVCTGLDDFFRQVQVVIQRVELLVRIAQVTGVRHGNFGDGSVSIQRSEEHTSELQSRFDL